MLEAAVAGSGTPLLLLHGWALDRRAWSPQFEPLSPSCRVVALDRRGFGRSTAPPDLAAEIDDLLAVREALGVDRMVLVGMSQGARTALHFAFKYPALTAGLVLQGAALDGFQPEPRGEDAIPLEAYRELVRNGRIEAMKALWREHPLMRRGGAAELLADYDGRDLLVEETPPPALAGLLGAIEAPALIVTGGDDVAWRQLVGDALAYGLPNARRAWIAGGHLCNLSQPAAYNELVASFVAGLAA